jgi:hypothetical protein
MIKSDRQETEVHKVLKYKDLWQVEHPFRNAKSLLETMPIFHKCDETIRGHVFCSFLAPVLKKEPYRRLEAAGNSFEWADIKQDLKSLQGVFLEEDQANGSPYAPSAREPAPRCSRLLGLLCPRPCVTSPGGFPMNRMPTCGAKDDIVMSN